MRTDKNGKSAGVAIITQKGRTPLGKPKGRDFDVSPSRSRGRLAWGWAHTAKGPGLLIVNIYLWTVQGVTSDLNVELLNQAAYLINDFGGPWLLGGDFNCTPEQLSATGWPDRMKAKIIRTGEATCNSGRELDFFVLDERESRIVRERFGLDGGEPRTLAAIGEDFGLTKERIRQIERIACRKLLAAMDDPQVKTAPVPAQAPLAA